MDVVWNRRPSTHAFARVDARCEDGRDPGVVEHERGMGDMSCAKVKFLFTRPEGGRASCRLYT